MLCGRRYSGVCEKVHVVRDTFRSVHDIVKMSTVEYDGHHDYGRCEWTIEPDLESKKFCMLKHVKSVKVVEKKVNFLDIFDDLKYYPSKRIEQGDIVYTKEGSLDRNRIG